MYQVLSNGDTSMVHHGTSQTFPLSACLQEEQVSRIIVGSQIHFDSLLCVKVARKPQQPTAKQPAIRPCLPVADGLFERIGSTHLTPNRG